VRETYDELENEKRRLLDLPITEKGLVSEPFDHGATLRIWLEGQGRPSELGVCLGGENAAPLGGYVYQLRANADRTARSGRLVLEIR
jgi:hypothetical protein